MTKISVQVLKTDNSTQKTTPRIHNQRMKRPVCPCCSSILLRHIRLEGIY